MSRQSVVSTTVFVTAQNVDKTQVNGLFAGADANFQEIYTLLGGAGGTLQTAAINLNPGVTGKLDNFTIGSIAPQAATFTNVILGTVGSILGVAKFNGNTSGTITVQPQAVAGTATLTFPNTTGTFAVGASAPLALNTTTGALSVTGAAGQVLAGSPAVFTATPVLGVNATTTGTLGFANGGASGATTTLQPSAVTSAKTITLPANTGTLVGSGDTNTVTNTILAQMGASTIKGNNTGGTTNATDLTVAQVMAMFTAPTKQTFSSGSGTYTTPANCKYILVEMVGGGGGGSGSGTSPGSGTSGGNTTFGSSLLVANGGSNQGGSGGSVSGGDINAAGASGQTIGGGVPNLPGGNGGVSPYGGAGQGGGVGGVGGNAVANSGSGGGGAGCGSTTSAGAGGSAGGFVKALIAGPSPTYSYAVGGAGSGGAAGTSGFAGGNGAAGRITVYEFYS